MTTATDTAHDAVYVYGIVAAPGRGQQPSGPDGVEFEVCGPVAAVIGSVQSDRPFGLAEDMRRHDRVVADFVRRGVTILPMRFGAVVAGRDTVARDVLAPRGDALVAALRELDGVVQYTVRVGYVRDAVLRAVVRADPQVAAARAAVQDRPSHAAQIRLGELVVAAIGRRRGADASRIEGALQPWVQSLHCTLAEDPDSVADYACLVRDQDCGEFEDAVEALAAEHAAAVQVKLLGPLAPYDFVPEL